MYTCNGCKMDGIGHRYRCDQHDFDLHEECISALPKMNAFHKYRCEFLKEPLSTSAYCEACGFPAKGFVFHCARDKKNLYFHPRCALLRTEIPLNDTKFKLRPTAPSNCHWCNKERVTGANNKIRGWAYVSEFGSGFHVHCVFEMAMQMRKNTKGSGGGIIDNKWVGKIGITVLKVFVSTLLGPLGGVVHVVDLF
ncbi:hypothetical protein Cgig2_001876 [Carnegiea gigantea]|uniref:DC1 domain-containing protein n=1 Tax=Carnegiea gigantea TaxID=171969 RepID=A0A9Q1Q9H9_9CARY|nr:hypothetical protein Cgig2_001876 [Carnegiea gigantea]